MGSPLYRLGVGTATLTSPITMGGGPLRRRSDVRFGSKADMCSAIADVCFGPKADTDDDYSITSSARPISVFGTVRPSALAVLRLTMNSTLVDCWTGRSAGF